MKQFLLFQPFFFLLIPWYEALFQSVVLITRVFFCIQKIAVMLLQFELNLVRDVKNKKGFYRCIGQKRQAKESIPPLLNEKGKLAITDMEKAEVLNEFFASVFTGSQDSHIPEPLGGNWCSKLLPHCKGRASPRPTHGTRWCASQGPKGAG